jgi:antitoxin component YwqK of YwqJK toxin-antitoxin module
LQPEVREEQFGSTPLRLRRQIRLVEFDPLNPPGSALEIVNGKPFMIVNSGHWRVLDSRGNPLVDGRYENDQQHGRWTTYHANGRRAAEGLMVHGVKSGPWRTWDEEGLLLSEVAYPAPSGQERR